MLLSKGYLKKTTLGNSRSSPAALITVWVKHLLCLRYIPWEEVLRGGLAGPSSHSGGAHEHPSRGAWYDVESHPAQLERVMEKWSPQISAGWCGGDGCSGIFPCITLCVTDVLWQRAEHTDLLPNPLACSLANYSLFGALSLFTSVTK